MTTDELRRTVGDVALLISLAMEPRLPRETVQRLSDAHHAAMTLVRTLRAEEETERLRMVDIRYAP